MKDMDSKYRQARSQLFTVRLWSSQVEDQRGVPVSPGTPSGGTPPGWRGEVRHVASGRVQHFRDWNTLVAFFEEVLSGRSPDNVD